MRDSRFQSVSPWRTRMNRVGAPRSRSVCTPDSVTVLPQSHRTVLPN